LKRLVFLLWAGALVFPLAAQNQEGAEAPAADPRAAERGVWFDRAEGDGNTQEGVEGRGETRARSGGSSLLQALLILALTALAVYGVVSFLKKRPRGAAQNDRYLKLLAAVPINAKSAAAVIAVGNKAWLAGVTDGAVSLLAEISDQETVDAMTLEYEQRAPAASGKAVSFAGLLRRIAGARAGAARKADEGGRESGAKAGAGTSQAENLRSYRDRLRGL
jgi:flagellar biogenesis protein FliO